MKQVSYYIFFCLLTTHLLAYSQQQTESRIILYPHGTVGEQLVLQPGESIEREVDFTNHNTPQRRILRVVGGVQMPGKFATRGEEYFRQQEFFIDDNIDSLTVYKEESSLYFKGDNEPYERYAYNRITGVSFVDGYLDLEIAYKRKKLKVGEGGDFGIELQIYNKKEDRHPDDIYDAPDSIMFISLPQGNGGFRVLKKRLQIAKKAATVLVRVGGSNFSGEVWLESPRFSIAGKKVFHSPFVQDERKENDYNYWVGVNLATRSWPRWRVEFEGKTVFEDYIFDRASEVADFYITLPKELDGKGRLKLTLEKELHRASYPYELRSLELLEESARDFEIVSVPRFVSVGDTTAILIETNRPNLQLDITSQSVAVSFINKQLLLEKEGLHAIEFLATKASHEIEVELSNGVEKRIAVIDQTLIREKDDVYLSSGDEIYIDKEFEPYNYFFKWYLRNRIGNWYHLRPSNQWSGVRITKENVMQHYIGLLNQLRMPYAWQVEGRTLAASKINLSLESLQSPMFRGKQAHENDGGYYYWQHFHYNGLHSDISARIRPYGGIFAKHRPLYTDHGIFIHYDPYGVKDMADGANKLVANFSYSRGESTRHTGPSITFRYLYQAGYEWLGAEQMYGPEDIMMSSLRGASRAYGKKDFGSLHAVQWGSRPFTDPKHSLRFYLSLATAYMHGSSHINTEEGLWTDEYVNDRYSESGKQHLYAQHQMLDYIETHSRRGEIYVKIAVVQGRNDAWKAFGRTPIWSQKAKKWEFNKSMESFDFLKVFYPDSNVDYCSTDGLFSQTPYGPIDIVPIEASLEVLEQYEALIFLGWNTFDNTDFIRIKKFVEQGGTVLLAAPHLNSELQPHLPPQMPEDDSVVKQLVGNDYRNYKGRTTIPMGRGKIIYYPENLYPAELGISDSYTRDMNSIAADIISKEYSRGWVKSSPSINFSVWDSAEMRSLYLLNVDWASESEVHSATFILGDHQFRIQVPRYTIRTIRVENDVAVMLDGNTSDILKIDFVDDNCYVTCQTTGEDVLTIFDGVAGKEQVHHIASAGIHQIPLIR